MAQASPISNTKVRGQPTARRYQRFHDQHGRIWGAMIELKTGDPTCAIDPVGWKAPIMPAQKYMRVKFDADGIVETGGLLVDYTAWIADARQARKAYDERAGFFASCLYSEAAGEKIKQMPPELRRLLKRAPEPVEPIVAAAKGDPWALGLERGDCPDYLRPYFAAQLVGDDDLGELELDPEFVRGMEAAFLARSPAANAELAIVAEKARADAERENAVAAAAAARRGGGR